MDRDQAAGIKDLDLLGELMDLDDAPGAIRHAVVIAANADLALMGDPPLEFQHGPERQRRRRSQLRPLLGETMRWLVPRTRRLAMVSSQSASWALGREVAEAAGEEEVLADVAERPLDLPFVFAR